MTNPLRRNKINRGASPQKSNYPNGSIFYPRLIGLSGYFNKDNKVIKNLNKRIMSTSQMLGKVLMVDANVF